MQKKVALLLICLNPNYWQFLSILSLDIEKLFLKGHQVDKFIWSDLPLYDFTEGVTFGAKKIIPTEPIEWPMPTLLRYHLFLQEEETLKDYDYIFYIDVDMRIVDTVGDEILGEGLTMAEHPMYALRPEYVPPYEPNPNSSAFIPRLGVVIENAKTKQKRFKPLYAAGGFQGGKAGPFIEAMKEMRKNIDKDFVNNYIARWNDESHWNKYLFGYKGPLNILSPSYVYPDSLIEHYYTKIWGCNYPPKIITLTKKFTTTKEGGDAIKEQLQTM